jgi:biotin carboxyl carrier protein
MVIGGDGSNQQKAINKWEGTQNSDWSEQQQQQQQPQPNPQPQPQQQPTTNNQQPQTTTTSPGSKSEHQSSGVVVDGHGFASNKRDLQ